jgi:hypothetical protein
MMMAPPAGGAMLDHHWLFAWALVPATVAAIGLVATLVWSGATARATASPSA